MKAIKETSVQTRRQQTGRERLRYSRDLARSIRYWLTRKRHEILVTEPPAPGHEAPAPNSPDYYVAVAKAYRIQPYLGAVELFVCDSTNLYLMAYWNHFARGGVRQHRLPGTPHGIASNQTRGVVVGSPGQSA